MADRVLIVFDGEAWFVRRVRVIEHDLDRDEKVYRCDAHLGGPFDTLADAINDDWQMAVSTTAHTAQEED